MDTHRQEVRDLALNYGDGKLLAGWYACLDRLPKALEWNAYRSEGQVFSRVDLGNDIAADRHAFWSFFEDWAKRGLLVVDDVTEEVSANGRANYLKIQTTEKGRAAIAVWHLRYGE